MGTRATLTFKDEHESFTIYKHWDGYPSNIMGTISNALPFAWELPRFQADDFSTAYIAANKSKGGGGYLLNS